LQLKVIQAMCLLGEDIECIKDASIFYNEWKQNKSKLEIFKNFNLINFLTLKFFLSLSESFYPTFLCTTLKFSNETDWFYIYDLALNIHSSSDRFSLISSLTCSHDVSLLELYD
jgi:hypothetical protein